MAVTNSGKSLILEKLSNAITSGSAGIARCIIGNTTYDGIGVPGQDANAIATKTVSFSVVSQTLGLTNTNEIIEVPTDKAYTVDRVYINKGATDPLQDVIFFQSLGLSTTNDTNYTIGGNWVINTFDITISEVI